MANNRLALVCKDCKVGMGIAKYYPMVREGSPHSTIGGVDSKDNAGWYQGGNGAVMQDAINAFFVRHKHDYDFSNTGGSQYYLGYENDGKDWMFEYKDILSK